MGRSRRACANALFLMMMWSHGLHGQLAGTWRLDNTRSNGVPPSITVAMTIAESGATLLIESRYRLPQGPVVLSDTMILGGRSTPYIYKRPNGQEGVGVRTAKALAAGTGVEITDSVLLDTPIGPAPRWTTQTWTVDPNTGTLTQEITVHQPFVVTPVKNLWIRERS